MLLRSSFLCSTGLSSDIFLTKRAHSERERENNNNNSKNKNRYDDDDGNE